MKKDFRSASRRFWTTVRRLRSGRGGCAQAVFSKGGETLTSSEDIVGRWKEHFEELLNPEASGVSSSISLVEVTEVVGKLFSGKALGVDEIRPEMLKALDIVGLSWLTHLCNIAWTSGTVPLDWQTGVVVPIFKKGDRRVCANYWGITLLSLPGKVYAKVLERRLRPIGEPQIEEEQCGFRPGRGTMDQLFTLSRIVEGALEFANPVYMRFVDLEKAYDYIPRHILWEVLREYGALGLLLRAICSLYSQRESCVRILSNKSDPFSVSVGLRQGCALSPLLFVIFMVSRHSRGQEGIMCGGRRVASLLFADDVVLLAESHGCLQCSLERFAAECEAVGMRISTSKSESMVLSRKRMACSLQVRGKVLPQVEEFKYLRVLFTSHGKRDREIGRRLGQATAVMRSLYRTVVVKRELSRKAKLSIYRSVYVPTLTYAHELWVMTGRMRSRIQAAEMSFLRRVVGYTLFDRVRSSAIREELRVEPLSLHVERSQLRWFVHLIQMPPGRHPVGVHEARPTGTRPRGRPRTHWRDYISKLAWERLGVPGNELEEAAGHRVIGILCSPNCYRDPIWIKR
ncbi:hypothetical protein AOLI_G00180560 [Acnodon oligacanthus]